MIIDDTDIPQWTGTAMLQLVACRLFLVDPLLNQRWLIVDEGLKIYLSEYEWPAQVIIIKTSVTLSAILL